MAVIKVEPWGKGQGDHVLIDGKDFDPEIHVKFGEGKKKTRSNNQETQKAE